MESLAYLVVVLLSLLMLSGPVAIGLTSARAQRFTEGKPALAILRRIIAFGFGLIGTFIAIQLMYETTTLVIKLMAIISISGSIYALRREIKYTTNR